MRQLRIDIPDNLFAKLELMPDSDNFICSLLEEALGPEKTMDNSGLMAQKLMSIENRLKSIEDHIAGNSSPGPAEPSTVTDTSSADEKPAVAANPESGEVGEWDNDPFYTKMKRIRNNEKVISVDEAPSPLKQSILQYLPDGMIIKKQVLISLLSVRYPMDEVEKNIEDMIGEGAISILDKEDGTCVQRS
ncbi:hypothetical protein [Methanohalophilus profundi]|uniref:hypothetical protein n=1 Tax=Methanohalophilus profundi TaxID=2138083 RepID=UPI0013EDFA5A|nr:hypothetical protein [Methanohalophilus profundi]